MPGGFGICTSRGWNAMKSSILFMKPNASMTCTNVSTTHASGEAKSAFNSLRAIVSIMVLASWRIWRERADCASCLFFFARQAAEHVFETCLRGGQLIKAPATLDRAPHEFVGRVRAVRKSHAENAVACRLDAGHAVNGREVGGRWRMLESKHYRAAALELIQRGDRIVEHGRAVMQNLHAVAHAFDFGQDVGGQDDAALAAELADQVTDLANLVGVEPDGRLVENHDIRAVHDGL